jgi:aspartokinase-like uncharacterized kinase
VKASPDVVVKVGGSLYDLPDLGPRLRAWLDGLGPLRVLIVPGGGDAADVIRKFDERHQLGQERAHWLALASLSLTGRFLTALLPRSAFVTDLSEAEKTWAAGQVAVLDPYGFTVADEGQPGCLPHVWSATSDAVAARVAVVTRARRLMLLKSVPLPDGMDWEEAGLRGHLDTEFAGVVAQRPELQVDWVNLRGVVTGEPEHVAAESAAATPRHPVS